MTSGATAAEIARSLAEDVHTGVFQPAAMFPSERDLCERFAVGRNVIRESMTLLQGMGLADQSKGKRPRVVAPTLNKVMEGAGEAARFFFAGAEGLAHLEQARLFLETSLLRYCAAHATNAQIAKILEAIEACEANVDHVDGFRNADVQFHRALAEVPGNPIFTSLHDTFVGRLMRNRAVLPEFQKRNRASNQEHRDIATAILDRDAERAVEVLTRHLTRNFGTYFRIALDQKAEASAQLKQANQEDSR